MARSSLGRARLLAQLSQGRLQGVLGMLGMGSLQGGLMMQLPTLGLPVLLRWHLLMPPSRPPRLDPRGCSKTLPAVTLRA